MTYSLIDSLVKRAFTHAILNDYYILGWTDEAIANDMIDFDKDIAQYVMFNSTDIYAIKYNELLTSINKFRKGEL
jgi:hypothetical protein